MKTRIINISILFGLLFLQTTTSCQPQFALPALDFSFSDYSYDVGKESIYVCEIVIENSSDNEYVFWFDTASVTGYNEKKKIQSYFHQIRGDFSLYNLMTENLLRNKSPILFGSFLKLIRKKEKFFIRVIGGETIKEKCKKFINEHFVAIKKEELIRSLKLGDEFFAWYDRQSIVIKEEFLP